MVEMEWVVIIVTVAVNVNVRCVLYRVWYSKYKLCLFPVILPSYKLIIIIKIISIIIVVCRYFYIIGIKIRINISECKNTLSTYITLTIIKTKYIFLFIS